MNYNNKRFKPINSSPNSELNSETIFFYRQKDNILHCEYKGGNIVYGQLLGLVDEDGRIDMRYHQISHDGNINTGKCLSIPEILKNGKLVLHEHWEWTSGDLSKGSSTLLEI